jgi:hypothetical protein
MIPEQLTFHHLGLAASDPDRAKAFLIQLGYTCGDSVHDMLQHVHLMMCTHAHSPDVEIISRDGTPGPLDTMLSSSSSVLYHTCYRTESTENVIENLTNADMRPICVSEPTPAVLFDNNLVSFYMIRGFGLIEFLECN